MTGARHLLRSAWLGFALAGIFFYPLAAAVDSDPYYLQWQPVHAAEAGVALALLAVVFGAAIAATWSREGRGGTVAVFLVALLPLLSLGAGLSRQLPIDDALREAWERPLVRLGVPAVVGLGLIVAFVARPVVLGRWLRGALMVVSPVSLVVVESFVTSAAHTGPPVVRSEPVQAAATATSCAPVVALLFDELSFTYLYDGDMIAPAFPNVRRFAESATNHLAVTAPGPETLVSVPGYLAARRFDNVRVEGGKLEYELDGRRAPFSAREADGLFASARTAGLSTEAVGYYFGYCDLLGPLVDRCRSFSFYNMATVADGFSPIHPIQTTLILWPRQFPLGLLKNPPFARLQHGLVEGSEAFARRPIDPARPVFRFVHFSIPHLPFVYGPDGYDPPLNPLRQVPDDQYVRQLAYVDRLFGRLVDHLRQEGTFDRTTVVLFADHGFRTGGRERDVRHVPFIVKHPGQHARVDVREAQAGESLLRSVVTGSCGVS